MNSPLDKYHEEYETRLKRTKGIDYLVELSEDIGFINQKLRYYDYWSNRIFSTSLKKNQEHMFKKHNYLDYKLVHQAYCCAFEESRSYEGLVEYLKNKIKK